MKIFRLLHRFLVRQTMPSVATRYYDKLISAVQYDYLDHFCQQIVSLAQPGFNILDIGTGTGQLPVMLAKQLPPNCHITAVDLSKSCIRTAQQNSKGSGTTGRIDFYCSDILKLDLVKSFDLIISSCALHHWRYPRKVFRKASKLLSPHGRVIILDDCPDVAPEKRRAWINLVESKCKAGLLFRTVFLFESKFLAYSRKELEAAVLPSGLILKEYTQNNVFFTAILCKTQHRHDRSPRMVRTHKYQDS